MTELALYGLVALTGLLVAGLCRVLYDRTQGQGWLFVAGAGIAAAGIAAATTHLFGLLKACSVTTPLWLFLSSLCLSFAGYRLLEQYQGIRKRWPLQLDGLSVTGLLALAAAVGTPEAAAVAIYIGSLVISLSAVYYFFKLSDANFSILWRPFVAGAGLLTIYLSLKTASLLCMSCRSIVAVASIGLVLPDALVALLPVLLMTWVMSLLYGCYLSYHGVVRRVEAPEDDASLDELVARVERELGAVVGEPVAERLTQEAVDALTAGSADSLDDVEREELRAALLDAFGGIGPVADRKIGSVFDTGGDS